MEYSISIIRHSKDMPTLVCHNFFHSPDLFRIIEKTPGQTPYMLVATDDQGQVAGHMLVVLRRRGALMPPYLFTQGRVYGEGEYANEAERERIFGLMLNRLDQTLKRKLCLYIEFSNLSRKMFAYKEFRQCNYFPVQWMQIHNSLHSVSPEERLSEKFMKRITNATQLGVTVQEVKDEADVKRFYRVLHAHNRFRFLSYLPNERQFREMLSHKDHCRLYVCRQRDKVIGSGAVIYSGGDAYLWYFAAKSKVNPLLHPKTMLLWHCVKTAHLDGCEHFYFMDAGLPFSRSHTREFVLGFGGKPVSSYRWFRFSIRWINRLLSWCYRE